MDRLGSDGKGAYHAWSNSQAQTTLIQSRGGNDEIRSPTQAGAGDDTANFGDVQLSHRDDAHSDSLLVLGSIANLCRLGSRRYIDGRWGSKHSHWRRWQRPPSMAASGSDTLTYASSTDGVSANLGTNRLSRMETLRATASCIIGSSRRTMSSTDHDEVLTGDAGANTLTDRNGATIVLQWRCR